MMGRRPQASGPDVQVALATYNGEKYLEQQIGSLLSQTVPASFVVHDDDSTDRTRDLLLDLLPPGRTQVLGQPAQGSAQANFAYILEHTSAAYVMCCDQDDIWKYDKVGRLQAAMLECERQHGAHTPILIHSDLELIDEHGKKLADSYRQYQNLDPDWAEIFPRLLTQNVVVGCTVMVNRALLDRALPIPQEAVMHDWWLALVACAFGKVVSLAEPTTEYRRHQSNSVGARSFDLKHVLTSVQTVFGRYADLKVWYYTNSVQARAFAERYAGTAEADLARVFSSLPGLSWPRRSALKLRHGFRKVGTVRNLAWLAL
jgi:glycosyltransferase involved in cell wall biosynthesis